jgi:tetratricopeptide (TPR) repeat protein
VGDLTEEREFVRRSLEDLERERAAGDITDQDYEALRRRYEGKAAALDASAAAPAPVVASPPQRSLLRPLAWAVAVVALAVAAGLVVASSSGDRLPGDPAAGSITATGTSDALAKARRLVGEGQAADAIKVYDEVLEEDPANAEALAYRGWLVRLAGKQSGDARLVDKGLDYVNRAVAADPNYPDARFFKGLILFQDKDDPAAAVPELRAFLGLNPPPDMVPLVEDVLRRAVEAAAAAG